MFTEKKIEKLNVFFILTLFAEIPVKQHLPKQLGPLWLFTLQPLGTERFDMVGWGPTISTMSFNDEIIFKKFCDDRLQFFTGNGVY